MNITVKPYEKIYEIVRQIPEGQVATYGQIAKFVGKCTPRMVGYALAALGEDSDIPWHRVVNSKGKVSPRASGEGDLFQHELLKQEGIFFDSNNGLDLFRFSWKGPNLDISEQCYCPSSST